MVEVREMIIQVLESDQLVTWRLEPSLDRMREHSEGVDMGATAGRR